MSSTPVPAPQPHMKVHRFVFGSLEPDTRITFFESEFHVHSSLLKQESDVFRSLFSKDDRNNPTSQFTFKVKAEQVGGVIWCRLVSTKDFPEEIEASVLPKGFTGRFEIAFSIFLSAVYNLAYTFDEEVMQPFFDVTSLAEEYGLLRTLCFSLDGAIARDKLPFYNFEFEPCLAMEVSALVRHPALFREAVLQALAPWSSPAFLELEDEELKDVAQKAYNRVAAVLDHTRKRLRDLTYTIKTTNPALWRELKEFRRQCKIESRPDPEGKVIIPKFYFNLFNFKSSVQPGFHLREELKELMKSNALVKDQTMAGEDEFEEAFLCVDVPDEELPWDITETDW